LCHHAIEPIHTADTDVTAAKLCTV